MKEAALFGKGLHAVAARRRRGTGDPAPSARPSPAPVSAATKVESITPTLEDVFVSLIEARDRADAPPTEVRR